MDETKEVVDCFENYLKDDLQKQKQKTKEIERHLKIIKTFKTKKSKNKTETDLNLNESLLGESSSSAIPVDVRDEQLYLNNAKQFFMMTDNEDNKLELIFQLFRSQTIENAVIYCNSLEKVENLTTFMIAEGFNVQNMVGKNPKQRKRIIEDLNSDDLQIEGLITVRRIDSLRNISLFVNYDLPTRQTYLKRVGSREKSCYKYFVVNIITKQESNKLMSYGKYLNTHIVSLPIITN